MNTEGDIKLCDFGTSRILEGPSANGVTFIGTMNYMSPERLEGNVHAVAGDVFSLGLTLMELATGSVIYEQLVRHAVSKLSGHVSGTPAYQWTKRSIPTPLWP